LTLKQYREDLFHEFGHALHEMLTEADFPSLAGTDVLGDFVELPAQLFELSALDDAVLTKFARHYQTGEVMPQELREKIRAADTFNMGFETAEFIASSALDLEWHSLQDGEVRTVEEIERTVIDMLKLPDIVQPLHLSTHFVHITSGYDSSYYSYLWAEMLKADAAGAFVEAGDVFDPKTARRLRTTIYAPGDSRAPQALFQDFRGRGPVIQPLLKERGFSDDAEEAPLPPPAAQAAVRSSPLTL
jgi:peptidyl-dipeptidase Dcp